MHPDQTCVQLFEGSKWHCPYFYCKKDVIYKQFRDLKSHMEKAKDPKHNKLGIIFPKDYEPENTNDFMLHRVRYNRNLWKILDWSNETSMTTPG